jgi:hypothetical protein
MNVIEQIDREIEALEKRKAAIQKKCSHPDITKINKGDSGNILTGRDQSYWSDNTCNLCGHRWTSEQ